MLGRSSPRVQARCDRVHEVDRSSLRYRHLRLEKGQRVIEDQPKVIDVINAGAMLIDERGPSTQPVPDSALALYEEAWTAPLAVKVLKAAEAVVGDTNGR